MTRLPRTEEFTACLTEFLCSASRLEHRIALPDASVKHLNILGKAEREAGRRLRISAAVMDITEARRTAELLRKSKAELAHVTRPTTMGELVASISHEINQPLGVVKLNAQTGLVMAQPRAAGAGEGRDVAGTHRRQRSPRRRPDRRDPGHARRRRMRRRRQSTSIASSATWSSSSAAKPRRGGVACLVDLDHLRWGRSDPIQLQQILVNFLMNGFDAMAATPRDSARDRDPHAHTARAA